MNVGAVFALLLTVGVLVYGLFLSAAGDSLMMFYDFPSTFIVLGGVIAAAALGFQFKGILKILRICIFKVTTGKTTNFNKLIKEMIGIIDSYRKGESLRMISDKSSDLFLKEALDLLDGGILSPEQTIETLEERNDQIYFLNNEDTTKLKVMGKYPPAFGMMGTTMGMIVLLANLNGADAIKKVGPAMGVCLITTLYGTILANFGFLPMADNLVEQAKDTYQKNRIIIETVKFLIAKENPIVAAEKLNSFLHPKDRLDWKTVIQGNK